MDIIEERVKGLYVEENEKQLGLERIWIAPTIRSAIQPQHQVVGIVEFAQLIAHMQKEVVR